MKRQTVMVLALGQATLVAGLTLVSSLAVEMRPLVAVGISLVSGYVQWWGLWRGSTWQKRP